MTEPKDLSSDYGQHNAEIVRLTRENEAMRKALEPFAILAGYTTEKHKDNRPVIFGLDSPMTEMLTVGMLRAAASAIKEPSK